MNSRVEKHSAGYTKRDQQRLKHEKPRAKPRHQREQDKIEIEEQAPQEQENEAKG